MYTDSVKYLFGFVYVCFSFISCSSPVKNTLLFNSYKDYSIEKLEIGLVKEGYQKLRSDKVLNLLVKTQKNVRTQAVKNIQQPESIQQWSYYVSADTLQAWIAYLPPKYVVISSYLAQQVDTISTINLSPLFLHFWAHYEVGHFKERAETMLLSEFGGVNLRSAIDFNYKMTINRLLIANGCLPTSLPTYPFSGLEEEKAEWLSQKAFKMGRKDSLEISDAWRFITPDIKWAEDYLKIHSGKTKMAE